MFKKNNYFFKNIFNIFLQKNVKIIINSKYGRNFLWRKELIPHFSAHYLFENFWNEGILSDMSELRACFIKLAMSLYIDHEPLQRLQIPNYCRLYSAIDILEDDKVFKEENNQGDEILLYD